MYMQTNKNNKPFQTQRAVHKRRHASSGEWGSHLSGTRYDNVSNAPRLLWQMGNILIFNFICCAKTLH